VGSKGDVKGHTRNWKLSLTLQERTVGVDKLLRLMRRRISIIPSSEVIPTPSRLLGRILHLEDVRLRLAQGFLLSEIPTSTSRTETPPAIFAVVRGVVGEGLSINEVDVFRRGSQM
jgi:hypothetical protein